MMAFPVICYLFGCAFLGWGAGKVQKRLNVESKEA